MSIDDDGCFVGGRYDSEHISDVPASYLGWLVEQKWADNELHAVAAEELVRRFGPLVPARQRVSVPAHLHAAIGEIITRGYRALARTAHPDTGGVHERMIAATQARQWLEREVLG